MRSAGDSGNFRLNLFGPFALYAPDGKPIKLTSAKARALLAMLVMADNGQRTRAWLQDKLWGRVGADAGRTSLRGELSRIRTSLSAHGPDPFRQDVPRDTVGIDLPHFVVDALTPGARSRREFLEGLDIPHESGFEDWLRDERSFFAESVEEQPSPGSTVNLALPKVPDVARPERLNLGILPVQGDLARLPQTFGPARFDDLLDRIIKLLQSIGGIDIEDHRIGIVLPNLLSAARKPTNDANLLMRVSTTSSRIVLTLQLITTDTGKVICNRRQQLDPEEPTEAAENESLQRFVIDSAEEIAFALTRRTSLAHQGLQLAARLAHDALTAMFGMSFAGLDLARANLDKACEQFQDSAFFAWRAYLTTHLLDDPRVTDLAALREEAQFYSKRALEIDPYDPLTLSLLSHVHSFALHDLPGARDMMRKAKSLSSDHVMTYDADALLSLYGGDLVRAKVAAMRAAKLGRHLPFRYCFMTSLCMIDAISGNYESAIASGEKALQLQPRTSEKPYPPTIRYLAACYTKIGKEERAGELFESLREADRKVGHTSRFDSDYVMPSLEIADFLRLGQKLLSD